MYIVNLYPAIEKKLPQDPDLILGREIDIKFRDRTKYDLKVAEMTTDYIDIIKELRDIAQDRELPKQAREILSKRSKISWTKMQKAKKHNDYSRKRRELLEGRFAVTKAEST